MSEPTAIAAEEVDAPSSPQSTTARDAAVFKSNAPKDNPNPKKIAIKNKDHTTAAAKVKRPTLCLREVSRHLKFFLPLHVANRACQTDMGRLIQTPESRRNLAIHGRASAVTAVAAFEYMAEEIFKGAIKHARKRKAGTVNLLDIQRSIIVNSRLARSLRYNRMAVSNSANPLGIVPGMMIGLKHQGKGKKKEEAAPVKQAEEEEDDEDEDGQEDEEEEEENNDSATDSDSGEDEDEDEEEEEEAPKNTKANGKKTGKAGDVAPERNSYEVEF